MATMRRQLAGAARPGRLAVIVTLVLGAGLASLPAGPQEESGQSGVVTNSARYRFEPNKLLALDLAVGDVRAESIRFEWPATLMRVKTAYKATIRVANGSSRQTRIGIAIALYDADARLIGAGTTGTTLGTVDPGDAAQFTIEFNHVSQRLEEANQFHIALEAK